MTWTNDFADGLARFINAAGVAMYLSDGSPYTDGSGNLKPGVSQPVVTLAALPAKPDQVIAIYPYLSTANSVLADVTQRVQFSVRGTADNRTVQAVQDGLFELLHGAVNLRLNGISITNVRQISAFTATLDDSGRWAATSNYEFDCARPTASRPD